MSDSNRDDAVDEVYEDVIKKGPGGVFPNEPGGDWHIDAWGTAPQSVWADSLDNNEKADIWLTMSDLGFDNLIHNYDKLERQIIDGGPVDGAFASTLDLFLYQKDDEGWWDNVRLQADVLFPRFKSILEQYKNYISILGYNEEGREEQQDENSSYYWEEITEAFGEGYEPAFKFINTQEKVIEALKKTQRPDAEYPEVSFPWELRIGASRFVVPPINISVNQSFRVGSLTGGALRQSSAPKFNTGHKETLINMTLYFPTHESIWGVGPSGEIELNEGSTNQEIDNFLSSLRGLITQFKYAPFLPIRNTYLNSAYNITGVTLHSMTVSTVENFPFCLAVNLQMLKFNHQVYMPMIRDFHQAIHWGRYREYMVRAAVKLEQQSNLGFLVEKTLNVPVGEKEPYDPDEMSLSAYEHGGGQEHREEQIIEYESEPVESLTSPAKEFNETGDWTDGRHIDIYFPSKTPGRVFAPDTSTFRTPEEDSGWERDKNVWESFVEKLGLNVNTEISSTYDDIYTTSTNLNRDPHEREILMKWLEHIGNAADAMTADALDDYLEKRMNDISLELGYGGAVNLPDDVRLQIRIEIETIWFDTIFLGFKETPFFKEYLTQNEKSTAHFTIKEWDVPMEPMLIDKNKVIVTGVSVSLANNIARLQVQMQDEPVHQHIGGKDTRVDISLTVFGEDDLTRFQRMFEHVNSLAQLEHAHGVLGFLGIRNTVTTLCGVKYVLPMSMETDTIPGYPHVYNVRLSFVDFDVFQQKREELSSAQQQELVDAFSKGNPFLRIKQLWGSFNAYPDFPLSIKDDDGDIVGHLDPDYMYRSYQMIDDDVVNWDLLPSFQLDDYLDSVAPSESQKIDHFDEEGQPVEGESGDSPATGAEPPKKVDPLWPSGFDVSSESQSNLDDSIQSNNYQHQVRHFVGLFDKEQKEASIMNLHARGLLLGTKNLDQPNSKVRWESDPALQGGGAAMLRMEEDVAEKSTKVPFVPGNQPYANYQSANADRSADPRKQFELMMRDAQYRDISGRMIRAFPTYMLWIIDEGGQFAGIKMFDNFYGLQSVMDFSILSSEDILGDTLTLRLSNLYGKLTTSYKDYIGDEDGESALINLMQDRARNISSGMTDRLVPLEHIRLRPGIRVHMRMGFSANPNALHTVFNGTITEVTAGDVVEVIAQSDAIELSPYVNSTNKSGHSGKLDGGLFTGMWLSEPRDLMVRLLSMGASTFREALAAATNGMIFSENRFGIRHFGNILYESMTPEEDQKYKNVRNRVGQWIGEASTVDDFGTANEFVATSLVEVGSTDTEEGGAFDANLGGFGVRSPVLNLAQSLWQNLSLKRDYEIFKRNIYPGNGLGVAQYLGGDSLDGGVAMAAADLEQVAASLSPSQVDIIDAQALADGREDAVLSEEDDGDGGGGILDGVTDAVGGVAGWVVDNADDTIWKNPVNPMYTPVKLFDGAFGIDSPTPFEIGAGILGVGDMADNPFFQALGISQPGDTDDDLTGFDEVSFRAQTYMKSVWDLFQVCAALLPNYTVAVRPFEDRSTVFYGKPHWLYTSGVIPLSTGKPEGELGPDMIEYDEESAELMREIAKNANPLADLEGQMDFFQGLTERSDPTNSLAGLEFQGTLDDVNNLPLTHPGGAVIPVRSGTIALEQHLPVAGGHLELPDLPEEQKYANGYHSLNGSSGSGAFGELHPRDEQWYMNMRWPYSNWAAGPNGAPDDPYDPNVSQDSYRGTKILVYNQRTGLAVVCTPGDAGPNGNTGRHAGISPDSFFVLKATNEDTCSFGFMPDDTPLGPQSKLGTGGQTPEEQAEALVEDRILDTVGEAISSAFGFDDEFDLNRTASFDDITYETFMGDEDSEKWEFHIAKHVKDFDLTGKHGEKNFYKDYKGLDLNDALAEYTPGEERMLAFEFGWLIDEVPVWIDPDLGGGDVLGSHNADLVGIHARRIYDEDYDESFDDGKSFGSLFKGQNRRNRQQADQIWDEFRLDFREFGWTNKIFDEWWEATQGTEASDDFKDETEADMTGAFMTYLWQDPKWRAWLVLIADKHMDYSDLSPNDWVDGKTLSAKEINDQVLEWVPGIGGDSDVWNFGDNDSVKQPAQLAFAKFLQVADDKILLTSTTSTSRDAMDSYMMEIFSAGQDEDSVIEGFIDGIREVWDATIGKLITTAAMTMSGLISLFRMSMMQLGRGLDMAGDFQRQSNILNQVFNDSIYYAAGPPNSPLRLADNPFTREYGEPVVEIREPFQRVHYLSSFQHIVDNKVTETLNDVATVVTASSDGKYPVTVYLDKGAPSERQVEKAVETGLYWDNARGSGILSFLHPLLHPIETVRGFTKAATGSSDEMMARRVGLWHLKEGLKDIYGGELTVLGDAAIRPHDLVYLADVYERMYGMFEVEQVIHHFTPETGFITSITPNALVTINDPARWSVISWAWSWWAVKNTRDDLRQIMQVKVDGSSAISNEGVTTTELSRSLETQMRGQVQYTHGSSALVRDVASSYTGGRLKPNAYEAVENDLGAIDTFATGLTAALPFGGPGAVIAGGWMLQLAWPAWEWVRDNLLDQHGCYIQYLTKDGQPMDAGLSYNQGMVVGKHHSTNLLPGILGLDVPTKSPYGHNRITTNDLLGVLGWNEVDVADLYKDISWWVNQTNARILEAAGEGPDPINNSEANVIYGVISSFIKNEEDEIVGGGDYSQGIIDGDTIHILLTGDNTGTDIGGLNTDIIQKIRLSGVSAPELQFKTDLELNAASDRGFLARQFLEQRLVTDAIAKGYEPTVAIRMNPNEERGEYDRLLGTVFFNVPEGTAPEDRERVLMAQASSSSPFIAWDEFLPDGRPYTANWDLIVNGHADVSAYPLTRNDPDRGIEARGD